MRAFVVILVVITALVLIVIGFASPLLALISLGMGLMVGGIPWLILTILEHQDSDNRQ